MKGEKREGIDVVGTKRAPLKIEFVDDRGENFEPGVIVEKTGKITQPEITALLDRVYKHGGQRKPMVLTGRETDILANVLISARSELIKAGYKNEG